MPPSSKRQRQREREQAARAAQVEDQRRDQRRRTWMSIGGLTVLVLVLAFAFSFFGGGDDDDSTDNPQGTVEDDAASEDQSPDNGAEPIACPPEDGSAERIIDFPASPPDCLVPGATYEAVFDTTEGEIRVALDTDKTPQTTNNFVYLARYHYYDETDLFRTNTGIDIIQGGSPHTNTNADPGPGYTIIDEGDAWTYQPGDLVMARTPAPNSASAQFFFSTGPSTADLDSAGSYVVFGKVAEGMETLDAMMANHVDGDSPGEGQPDPIPVVTKVTINQS